MGGTTLGRPYASGSFSVSNNGEVAYSLGKPSRPADIGYISAMGKKANQLTKLNEDILAFRQLGKVETVWYKSSFDQRDIQGWLVYPPNYDATKKYPLLVENHGGPISNYGNRFSIEMQLYAAHDYLVFYPNPR